MGSLSDVQVKNLKPGKKSYKKFDGDNLFIEVRPTGRKTWFQKYSIVRIINGVEKRVVDQFHIGRYPAIGLKKAREISLEIQAKIAQGIDPKAELRKNLEEAKKQEEIEGQTFEATRKEWWKKWKLTKAVNTQENRKRHLQPFMNDFDYKPITKVEKMDIKHVLDILINDGKIETAKRGLWAVREIFKHAIICGYCDNDPTLYLEKLIIKKPVKHHVAITDPIEVGKLLKKIKEINSRESVKYCLQIMAYLPLRSTEIRGARWKEIDLENAEWTIPATRAENELDGGGMKNRKEHRVPLSRQVLNLFQKLKVYTGNSEFCFPRTDKKKCITEGALHMALRRMEYHGKMTPHGFRTTFSTLCNEHKNEWGISRDEIEYQLAHSETDQVRAAYNRAEYFDVRKAMMQKWADYLDQLRDAVSRKS